MELNKKLKQFLNGEINDQELISQILGAELTNDYTESLETLYIKEAAVLRSMISLLLLEIKYPTVKIDIELDNKLNK